MTEPDAPPPSACTPIPKSLTLPPSTSDVLKRSVTTAGAVVIVGANGSGKTRLGAWLDMQGTDKRRTHRIAAQRTLRMPEASPTASMEIAENGLLLGYAHRGATQAHKASHRWGKSPEVHILTDYDQLLVYLFTEEFEKSTAFRQAVAAGASSSAPTTHLDSVKRIWESVLPARQLTIKGGKIEVLSRTSAKSAPYHASEMSDGERGILYLIGQCLAAPKDGVLVIDEPELHLHQSLQARLWDAIETERPDCLFVYLTHSLDFAASRIGAARVWLRGYEEKAWDWVELPDTPDLPTRLVYELLGSRKPILFVEGERGNLDDALYGALYPDRTVVPSGSCSAVIHRTRSFRSLGGLHHLDCHGVIDRDGRDGNEAALLEPDNVFTLKYAEIENVLLREDVIASIASALHHADPAHLLAEARRLILEELGDNRAAIAARVARRNVESQLARTSLAGRDGDELAAALTVAVEAMDPKTRYSDILASIDDVLARGDYDGALALVENKGLVPRVSTLLGFKPRELQDYILRAVRTTAGRPIANALRSGLPLLPGAGASGTVVD